jgi:tRNA (guanine-N7-)-methyltransferase
VRQHVNPLSSRYQQPIAVPNWSSIYADLSQPLHLDIGCGKGRFLLNMAQLQPNYNYLGLEIREPLVHNANKWTQDLGLNNLYYLFCNANTSLKEILSSFPPQSLHFVSIQFPDPWFKKKHQKRRVIQPELVQEIADYLVIGGTVFVQSDLLTVEEEICDRFAENANFYRTELDWLETNPLPVPTEREKSTISRGEPVYRAIFMRK